MELGVRVAGIELEHPIMNAAGPRCKTLEQIQELVWSPAAAVMAGSITWEARPGNQGDVYHSQPGEFSLNSLGLPNGGRVYYAEYLSLMAKMAHNSGCGKTLWVSVAGFTPREFEELTGMAFQQGADLVELNLGCPNVWDGGKQKRIFSFDPGLVEAVLQHVEAGLNPDRSFAISVKVSPFSDPVLLEEVASVIASSPIVSAVTAINTFPNGFGFREDGNSAISPQFSKGLAGMAGPALKAIGLGQVMQWRNLLPSHIDVIGVGGVHSGQDVLDYLKAGAKAVQIATAFADQGSNVFGRVLAEFVSLKEKEAVAS
jgi:dihydroorotate dehydrogenase (fumarate)